MNVESHGTRWTNIVGWVAVVCSTAITCFWAFWGIIENFHEGWHSESAWMNIAVMFIQYLSPMVTFLALGAVSIQWPRVGAVLHVVLCAVPLWFMGFIDTVIKFIVGPMLLLAAGYWFGRPEPRRWAAGLLIGATALTLIICGAEPAWRVAGRINDGDLGARVVEGNGVTLVWAPQGPGWPHDEGVEWDEAMHRCRYLTEDGTRLADEPQNIWRLPTVDEAVRSMHRHGKHCHGRWDAETKRTSYKSKPDKESPLWDIYSQVIYWWTADEIDEEHAYMIVYDGRVWKRDKTWAPNYFAFRAAKSVDSGAADTKK